MLQNLFRTIRASALGVAAAFLFLVSASAANTSYLIYSHSVATQPIFAISNAVDAGSAGILFLEEDGQSYGLPVYRAEPGCQVTVYNSAAQLRIYPIEIRDGQGAVQWTNELSPSIGQMRVTLSEGVQTIDASAFTSYASRITGAYTHEIGAGYLLSATGYYLVSHSDGGLAPSSVIVDIESATAASGSSLITTPSTSTTQGSLTAAPAQSVSAVQNSAPVLVNGKTVLFDAYTIYEGMYGYTYFKLRDLAAALTGTAKQYEVTWDKDAETVFLISGQPYTFTGNELSPGTPGTQTATLSTSPIYRDGLAVNLTAYVIGQNNYFKLRDIGQLFNFYVDWDNDAMCILIDTSKEYNA